MGKTMQDHEAQVSTTIQYMLIFKCKRCMGIVFLRVQKVKTIQIKLHLPLAKENRKATKKNASSHSHNSECEWKRC